METENKLPKEFKEKWVAALRSGEYKQARGLLVRSGAYCCLGVACRLAGYSDEDLSHLGEIPIDFIRLPKILIGGRNTNKIVDDLIKLNDRYEKPFPEIADWIEETL